MRPVEALDRRVLDKKLDHRLRAKLVRTLRGTGDPHLEETLLKALQDDFPIVRHEAISALGIIGTGNAREALEKFLDCESPYLRRIAAKAMIEMIGVPAGEMNNLKLLFLLLSSEDERIEKTMLQMGPDAMVFLASKPDEPSFSVSQYAARTIALCIRKAMDQLPPEQ